MRKMWYSGNGTVTRDSLLNDYMNSCPKMKMDYPKMKQEYGRQRFLQKSR
jgi:hypothetical protein